LVEFIQLKIWLSQVYLHFNWRHIKTFKMIKLSIKRKKLSNSGVSFTFILRYYLCYLHAM